VPEATAHQATVYYIYSALRLWTERVRGDRSVRIGQELAVRWLEDHPRMGADPDVCVIEPAPPDFDDLRSLKLWEADRVPPRLAIEVVSKSLPHKDYGTIQERYAAMGVEELVVIDPLLHGPRSLGGPVPLQLWRRDATGTFERLAFGGSPVFSEVLDAWFVVEGRDAYIADDRAGRQRWRIAEELLTQAKGDAMRAQAEAERAQAEAERAQAEAERERQARIELEQKLRMLEGK